MGVLTMVKVKRFMGFKQIWIGITLIALLFVTACSGANGSSGGSGGSESAKGAKSSEGSSASSGSSSDETVKIGVILSFTGPFAALANDIKSGFELYLEQNNQQLGKKKVVAKYEDDEGNPQVALRKYRQLVTGDKVDLIIAPVLSNVAYALRDEVVKDKKIMIVPNAAANDISWGQKSDYIYRVSLSNWQGGYSGGKYIAEHIGKKAITVANDYSAGKENVAGFKTAFEAAGGKVVKEIYAKIGTNDYGPFITEIAKEKPDVVYAFLAGNDGASFIKQSSDFGLKGKIPLTGSAEWGDSQIISATGDASEGLISAVFYTPWLDNELNKKFVDAYQKKYKGLPSMFSVAGFDSGKVLDQAIAKAGSVKSDDLKEALKGISWDSPRGPMSLDPKTNNVIQKFYMVKNTKKNNQVIPEMITEVGQVIMPESAPAK